MDAQSWNKRRMKRAVLVAGVLFVGLPILGVASCVALFAWGNRIETTVMGPFTSVDELVDRMACFRGLEIERSSYQSRVRARRFEMLPSPSDAWYERWGEIVLTPAGTGMLRSEYEWKAVERDALPQVVRELGPSGERFMISEEFNEKFDRENSSSYWNGFVLMLPSSESRVLYWFTRGEEHGIEDKFPPDYW